MTDPVLQSFCERCGTRYTATDPHGKPADTGGKGMLARFGRRGSEESAPEADPTPLTTSPASDAFADIFSFCMDCRQYTCNKCWNEEAHACLTCRPPGSVRETGSSVLSGGVVASGSGAGRAARPAVDEWGRPVAPESDSGRHGAEQREHLRWRRRRRGRPVARGGLLARQQHPANGRAGGSAGTDHRLRGTAGRAAAGGGVAAD